MIKKKTSFVFTHAVQKCSVYIHLISYISIYSHLCVCVIKIDHCHIEREKYKNGKTVNKNNIFFYILYM